MNQNLHKPKLLVTGADLAPQPLALLTEFDVIYSGKTPSEEDIVALCREHNPTAVILRYSRIGAAAMDAAPALQVISKHGSGTDTIDKVAAQERGIKVCAAVGANAAAVAEQALALLLACAKSIPHLNQRMHGGHWDKATFKTLELGGRTIGLVGLGAIGSRFARMVDAMGMRVLGHDPYATKWPSQVQSVPLEAIWQQADVISLHCPLTEDNRNLLNAETLARCKPGVIVINTARGGLVDEAALLSAVNSGQVRMAGLDSFAVEPVQPGHPFQGHDGFILSPHIGGVTADAYVNMGLGAARNVLDALASQAPAVQKPAVV